VQPTPAIFLLLRFFLSLPPSSARPAADADASAALCAELGVSVFPTIQFYRAGALLWQTCGHDSGLQDAAEGVLYFADAAAVRAHARMRLNHLCLHSKRLHSQRLHSR
jgi:hypothetical protein